MENNNHLPDGHTAQPLTIAQNPEVVETLYAPAPFAQNREKREEIFRSFSTDCR